MGPGTGPSGAIPKMSGAGAGPHFFVPNMGPIGAPVLVPCVKPRKNFERTDQPGVNSDREEAARCQPFLAVVRCLFHNHLRLKRSSLLNVYLNYKFEFSLLTSHLFFSLFILMFTTSVGYRLGLLMSTTCLNCARFYDGVKLFSFKRVYIRFSNFCQLLAKSTRQNWFSKKVHFLQIYKPEESVTLCSKFQFGFDLQRLSTFFWMVGEFWRMTDCF